MNERYEELWDQIPPDAVPEHFELRRDFLLGAVRPGERVLDLGCGAGEFSEALHRSGCAPVAVDVAEEPLRRARLRVSGLEARLWRDGAALPLGDASVDVVWAGEVIEHVPDLHPWLNEVRRVLRPGGLLVTTTPHVSRLRLLNRRSFEEMFDPLNDHVQYFVPRTMRGLLVTFGFDVESVRLAARRSLILASARKG